MFCALQLAPRDGGGQPPGGSHIGRRFFFLHDISSQPTAFFCAVSWPTFFGSDGEDVESCRARPKFWTWILVSTSHVGHTHKVSPGAFVATDGRLNKFIHVNHNFGLGLHPLLGVFEEWFYFGIPKKICGLCCKFYFNYYIIVIFLFFINLQPTNKQ